MNHEYTVALVRGFVGGLASFGIVALGTAQAGVGWEASLIAGGIAGLTYFAQRVGVEGTVDTQRKGVS